MIQISPWFIALEDALFSKLIACSRAACCGFLLHPQCMHFARHVVWHDIVNVFKKSKLDERTVLQQELSPLQAVVLKGDQMPQPCYKSDAYVKDCRLASAWVETKKQAMQ
jgi:hypothetical protein